MYDTDVDSLQIPLRICKSSLFQAIVQVVHKRLWWYLDPCNAESYLPGGFQLWQTDRRVTFPLNKGHIHTLEYFFLRMSRYIF